MTVILLLFLPFKDTSPALRAATINHLLVDEAETGPDKDQGI